MATSSYTPSRFLSLLASNPNGLGSVVAVVYQRRASLKLSVSDPHAIHALELMAGQKGLDTRKYENLANGQTHVTITGFASEQVR